MSHKTSINIWPVYIKAGLVDIIVITIIIIIIIVVKLFYKYNNKAVHLLY